MGEIFRCPGAFVGFVVLLSACSAGTGVKSAKARVGAESGQDAGGQPADASVSACSHYFDAQYLRCGGPLLPESEATRVRARFEQVCEGEMALPGSGMNAASVDACASALDASPCELPAGPPPVCSFHGSLEGGAPCNAGVQCRSGSCSGTVSVNPGGQSGPYTCGTCDPSVAAGQVCASASVNAACEPGSLCIITPGTETSPDGTYTRVPLVEGDVGESCDDLSQSCKTGLYCSAQAGHCEKLGTEGAPCGQGSSAPGNVGGCAPPLSCVNEDGNFTCRTGGTGAFCLMDSNCAQGLGCIPGPCVGPTARIGCAPSGTCGSVTWLGPGEPCDGYGRRCLVGSCNADLPNPATDGGLPSGVCPSIVPDGQPCTIQGVGLTQGYGPTCDSFSECFLAAQRASSTITAGTCTLVDSVTCR